MKNIDAVVVFIEDVQSNVDAICDDIEGSVLDIQRFISPDEGVNFIKKNVECKIIVVLDWSFAKGQIMGYEILKQIHEISALIPVIIFTGQDLDVSATTQMFEGQAFYCLSKDSSTQDVTSVIEHAYDAITNSINCIIENWIVSQPTEKRNCPYVRIGNKVYTMDEILTEIRQNTEIGRDVSLGVLKMTADLFVVKNKA